jgi:hypothetical protein
MFKKTTHHDVIEMVRDVGDDPAFADDLAGHVAERRLVTRLFALRCARGLSQAAEGVARFFDGAAVNFLTILEAVTRGLPAEVQPRGGSLVIVGPEDGPEVREPEASRPKRSRSSKAGSA